MSKREPYFFDLLPIIIGFFFASGSLAAQARLQDNQTTTPLEFGPNQLNRVIRNCVLLSGDHILDTKQCENESWITAKGNAKMFVMGHNSSLVADEITLDRASGIVAASGNVCIIRDGMMSKYSVVSFRLNSPEYLLTRGADLVVMQVLDYSRNQFAIAELALPAQEPVKLGKMMALSQKGPSNWVKVEPAPERPQIVEIYEARDWPRPCVGVRNGKPVADGPATFKYPDGTEIPREALPWAY